MPTLWCEMSQLWKGGASLVVCRSKPQKAVHGTGRTNPVVSHLQESQEYPLFLLGDDTKVQKPLEVTVQVDGHQL